MDILFLPIPFSVVLVLAILGGLWWAAGYNAVCVPLAIAGWLPPWLAGLGMAASSLAVVLNAARLAGRPLRAGAA